MRFWKARLDVVQIVFGEDDGLEQLRMRLALILVEELSPLHELFLFGQDYCRFKYLGAIRSLFGISVKHLFNDLPQFHGIRFRDSLNFALAHSLVETLHGRSLEWWLESDHFVKDAAK